MVQLWWAKHSVKQPPDHSVDSWFKPDWSRLSKSEKKQTNTEAVKHQTVSSFFLSDRKLPTKRNYIKILPARNGYNTVYYYCIKAKQQILGFLYRCSLWLELQLIREKSEHKSMWNLSVLLYPGRAIRPLRIIGALISTILCTWANSFRDFKFIIYLCIGMLVLETNIT